MTGALVSLAVVVIVCVSWLRVARHVARHHGERLRARRPARRC